MALQTIQTNPQLGRSIERNWASLSISMASGDTNSDAFDLSPFSGAQIRYPQGFQGPTVGYKIKAHGDDAFYRAFRASGSTEISTVQNVRVAGGVVPLPAAQFPAQQMKIVAVSMQTADRTIYVLPKA
jgi:hypothetical protein